MKKQDEKKLLNTLKSIDSTVKSIERLLMAEKQHDGIKETASYNMQEEKYKSERIKPVLSNGRLRGGEVKGGGKNNE